MVVCWPLRVRETATVRTLKKVSKCRENVKWNNDNTSEAIVRWDDV
jgi:hypothetical protein